MEQICWTVICSGWGVDICSLLLFHLQKFCPLEDGWHRLWGTATSYTVGAGFSRPWPICDFHRSSFLVLEPTSGPITSNRVCNDNSPKRGKAPKLKEVCQKRLEQVLTVGWHFALYHLLEEQWPEWAMVSYWHWSALNYHLSESIKNKMNWVDKPHQFISDWNFSKPLKHADPVTATKLLASSFFPPSNPMLSFLFKGVFGPNLFLFCVTIQTIHIQWKKKKYCKHNADCVHINVLFYCQTEWKNSPVREIKILLKTSQLFLQDKNFHAIYEHRMMANCCTGKGKGKKNEICFFNMI